MFEAVLNPKAENKIEEPIIEETKEQVAEEAQAEEAHVEAKFDRKRKEREPVVEEEIPEAERLNRPEGAVGVAEYRETLKEKNKALNGPVKGNARINIALPSDVKVMEKETVSVKAKTVTKEKKKVKSIQQVDVNFKTEDLSNANAKYVKPGYQQPAQQKAKPQKAKINFDDLPTL